MNEEKQLNYDTIENAISKAYYLKVLTPDEIQDFVTKLVDKLKAFKAQE